MFRVVALSAFSLPLLIHTPTVTRHAVTGHAVTRHAVTVTPPVAAETRLVLAATGNEARYRVREQLAGVDFPNDAVGVTSAITGEIVLDDAGKVIPSRSRIT